jgi:predicted aspartyl protease
MPIYDASRFAPPAPVARVSFRNPDSGETVSDILMVIDTGADMSFIPVAVVTKLNLQFVTATSYELTAFDGRSRTATPVNADMLFLGRTLKGSYLVRESEIGILGRDVLNHFALVLDGPNLHWQEAGRQ